MSASAILPHEIVSELPGYHDISLLYAVGYLQAFRAVRDDDGKDVFLKLCPTAHLETLARLRHNWTLQGEIAIQGASNPQKLLPFGDGGLMIEYGRWGERTSREIFLSPEPYISNGSGIDALPAELSLGNEPISRSRADILALLNVFVTVCDMIIRLHDLKLTHNNISPWVIFVRADGTAMLTDFSLTSRLQREDANIMDSQGTRRSLAYIPPEGTGRVNRGVDYRADFYSLGVVFYELFVGFLPFRSTDPLDMIHQHITKTPTPPQEINPEIPEAVSNVIMKLMAKNAEDRYQSAEALQADLRFIQDRYGRGLSLDQFILGHTDNHSRFLIPEKLYGREKELAQLFSAFEMVKSNGGSAVVTVSGISGVGKSRLVHEIQRPVVEARGRFASGKFDQYRRGIPFYALIQALQDLIRQVLSESESTLDMFRKQIMATLGAETNVLLDVIPEIASLLGPDVPDTQQEVLDMGTMEREERFKTLLVKFLRIFGPKGRPLVLFLDDLQWSTYHELQVIVSIAIDIDPNSQSIVMIGTYRSNEIDENHYLPTAIEIIRNHNILLQDIHLQQLSRNAISEMIQDTVRIQSIHEDFDMEALSEWVFTKTSGNAFFATHLLQTLHDQGDLQFDFDRRKWHFKIPEADNLPANVVDLIIRGLQRLPPETQAVIKLAACIGSNRFTLFLLSTAYQKSLEETATDLWPALKAGLIIPTSNAYQIPLAIEPGSELSQQWMNTTNTFEPDKFRQQTILDKTSDRTSNSQNERQGGFVVTYRFLHDKVQQSAMAMIPDAERPAVHRLLGHHLLHRMTLEDQIDGYIFEICNQLNKATVGLSQEESEQLIELNLRAGRKALRSTAFDGAMGYFETAQSLLGPDSWERQRRLTLDVFLANVERLYSSADYAQGVELADEALKHTLSPTEAIPFMLRKLDCQMSMGDSGRAFETGLSAAHLLGPGLALPHTDSKAESFAESMSSRIYLSEEEILAVADMPPLTNETLSLLQEILCKLALPAYLARPRYLRAVCYLSFYITRNNGVSHHSAYPLLQIGAGLMASANSEESMNRGFAFGRLAIRIIETHAVPAEIACSVYNFFASHIMIWHRPLVETQRYFLAAITKGIETYDITWTCIAVIDRAVFGLFAGESLDVVQAKLEEAAPLIRKNKQEVGKHWLAMPMQLVQELRGLECPNDTTGPNSPIDAENVLVQAKETQSHTHLFAYHCYQLIAAVFNGKTALGMTAAKACETYLASAKGSFLSAMYTFYAATIYAENIDALMQSELSLLHKKMDMLRLWAKTGASTFEHKYKFLKVMMTKKADRNIDTLDAFDEAMYLAVENGFVHDAALYAEKCASWLAKFSPKRSALYLNFARRQYDFWGAGVKANELSQALPPSNVTRGFSLLPSPTNEFGNPFNYKKMSDEHTHTSIQSPLGPGLRNLSVSDTIFTRPAMRQGSSAMSQRSSSTDDDSRRRSSAAMGTATAAPRDSDISSELDLQSVMRASLAIQEGPKVKNIIVKLVHIIMQTAGANYGCIMLRGHRLERRSLHIEVVGNGSKVNLVDHKPLHSQTEMVPVRLCEAVSRLGEPIIRNGDTPASNYRFDSIYGKDPYFRNKHPSSILCMPISKLGVLYLENSYVSQAFPPKRLEVLKLLCAQAAVTIEKAQMYRSMEEAKQAAEAATAMKSTFLANMSHEIRTPFNAVIACSVFLLDTQLTSTQKEYCETIHTSATELLRIIDDILDFSKIEHGRMELEVRPFSLRDSVETALAVVADPAAAKNVDLVYDNQHNDFPDKVLGDVTRFRQILLNLLGNAVKFTEQGHILVKSQVEEMPRNLAGRVFKFQITVEDTGIGISQDKFELLFRAFSQIDNSNKRNYGGTGLGLAICEKLVQLMDGKIWVESQEGVGTKFHFTMILNSAEEKAPDSPVPNLVRQVPPDDRQCLVIEHSDIVRELLCRDIGAVGLQGNAVSNLAQARDCLKINRYSIIIVDGSLSKSDAFVQEVADTNPYARVIVASNLGYATDTEGVNIVATLIKPIRRWRLIKALQQALNRTPSVPMNEIDYFTPRDDQRQALSTLAFRHPLRILLAEDNPINTKVALQHLKRMGYTADHAKDGLEVLELCERAALADSLYDVILLDIQMPNMDGYEATRILRQRYANDIRPILVAVTANATSSDKERSLEAGMDAHLSKPILPNGLADVLTSIRPKKRSP